MVETSDPEIARLYEPLIAFFDTEVRKIPGSPPEEVGKLVGRILAATNAKAEYMVGPGARKMKNLARLPRGLREELMYQAVYPRQK